MPGIVNFGGDDSMCAGGPLYYNFVDPSLFLSLASNVDLYCPSGKRSRINAPFIFNGEQPAAEPKKQLCSIDALPDECLFEIFCRLRGPQERSISACVSKRWLSILSSIRSSDISVQNNNSLASSDFVKKPLPDLNVPEVAQEEPEVEADSHGHLTRSLEFKEATDVRLAAMAVGTAGRGGLSKLMIRGSHPTRGVTDRGLSAVARGCTSLRVLTLWKVPSVTDVGLAEIAAGCPMLEKLSLSECPLISDKGLIAVAENCPNLLSLAIEACPGIENEGLQAIGRSCKKLQSISIRNCPLVGDVGLAGLVSSASSSLTRIKLQNLNVTDATLAVIGYYGKAVTDLAVTGLQNVAERGFWVMGNALGMQKLKSLFVTSCRGITDLGLQAIAKGCPNLKQLCLRKCCYLSDAGLNAYVEATRVLENLQLEECNRITLDGVLGGLLNCNTLKKLYLVKCLGIKDIGFYPTQLPVCMSLQSLTIRDCPGFSSCSLAFVGKICPQLQQIDLSGLVGVNDAGLLPLIESSRSGLVKVSLNGCVNITDAVVFALVKMHGRTLQLLHLDGCKNVSNRSLLAISDGCSVLVDLDMSKCAITDYGVAALASARQFSLQMLALAGCSLVTEKSLPFLGNMGQSLVGLNLQSCNFISTHSISLLEAKLWWCDIIS